MEHLFFEIKNNCGIIVLNRQSALNSLSFNMIKAITKKLKQWKSDKNIKKVLIKASDGRAFCAGGDIREIYDAGQKNPRTDFFAAEYKLNNLIANYPKPYIALIDGIVMGGGVGISFHGHHVIGTENMVFAMPETNIGFFPDIGASYFLTSLGYNFGIYLGLTGARLNAKESLSVALIDATCRSKDLADIEQALIETNTEFETMMELCERPPLPKKHKHQKLTQKTFGGATIAEIMGNLKNNKTKWASETLKNLRAKSPTSLALTLALYRQTKNLPLEKCQQLEYRLAYRLLHEADFYEGIKCAIIEKGKKPNWQAVPTDLDSYFAPLKNELKL